MELKPKEIGVELKQLMALAIDENPLVVHLRLGDYLLESSFGVPPKSYYQESISELMATGIYGKVWLFSDDLKKAQEYLSPELLITARVIGNVDDSTVATLEAMRHGKGYVIANSTFSWWGAFLSYENNPVVVAPTPWFQGMDSPQELIPPHWILKAAN